MSNILNRKSIQALYDSKQKPKDQDGVIVVNDLGMINHLVVEKQFPLDAIICRDAHEEPVLAVFCYNTPDECTELFEAIRNYQAEEEKFADFEQTLYELNSAIEGRFARCN